jgi:PAS domain-containing protein
MTGASAPELLLMTHKCAWCGKVMREGEADAPVTHGICPDCVRYFAFGEAQTIQSFLDKLEAPVLLVDGDGVVVTANGRALAAVGRDAAGAGSLRPGDFLECAYARLPGGCGNTVHCPACTIRSTVGATHGDGRSRRVEAFQSIVTASGPARTRLLITTEKQGPLVLLRIDEMGLA